MALCRLASLLVTKEYMDIVLLRGRAFLELGKLEPYVAGGISRLKVLLVSFRPMSWPSITESV